MASTIIETTANVGNAASTSKEAERKAEEGAAKVEETKQGMNDIVTSAQGTAATINSVANEPASGMQQIARAYKDLNRLTENLQDFVLHIKLKNEGSSQVSVRDNGVLIHE